MICKYSLCVNHTSVRTLFENPLPLVRFRTLSLVPPPLQAYVLLKWPHNIHAIQKGSKKEYFIYIIYSCNSPPSSLLIIVLTKQRLYGTRTFIPYSCCLLKSCILFRVSSFFLSVFAVLSAWRPARTWSRGGARLLLRAHMWYMYVLPQG